MSKALCEYFCRMHECTGVQEAILILDEAAANDDVSLKEYLHLRFVFDLVDWDSFVEE